MMLATVISRLIFAHVRYLCAEEVVVTSILPNSVVNPLHKGI